MPSVPEQTRDVAAEFATKFVEESFAEAADLLSEDGAEAVVESFPDGFQRGEMDAEDALEQFWHGLYGQYGEVDGVGDVTAGGEDGEVADSGDDDHVTVELTFADGTHRLELSIEDGEVVDFALPSEYEPPSYAERDAFEERDVTVDAGDVELDGVLAVPDDDGPFPGVVLVHGAGIHDPDGTAGNAKILKDFAWGLASQGVAVLRYEKRLRDHDVDPEEYTLDTVVVDDAVAAVDELAAVEDVDADSVFVAGHSQGGMAAPRIADSHGGVAGIVSLDGPVDREMDPDDVSHFRYVLDPEGELSEQQERQLEAHRETVQRLADRDFEPDDEIMGKPGRWFEDVLNYDPAGATAALDAPAFVASAGRADPDLQPEIAEYHEQKLAEWREVDLPEGSRVAFYERVGHYFQEAHEPTSMAHLYFADNAAGYVVADIAEWIHETMDA